MPRQVGSTAESLKELRVQHIPYMHLFLHSTATWQVWSPAMSQNFLLLTSVAWVWPILTCALHLNLSFYGKPSSQVTMLKGNLTCLSWPCSNQSLSKQLVTTNVHCVWCRSHSGNQAEYTEWKYNTLRWPHEGFQWYYSAMYHWEHFETIYERDALSEGVQTESRTLDCIHAWAFMHEHSCIGNMGYSRGI